MNEDHLNLYDIVIFKNWEIQSHCDLLGSHAFDVPASQCNKHHHEELQNYGGKHHKADGGRVDSLVDFGWFVGIQEVMSIHIMLCDKIKPAKRGDQWTRYRVHQCHAKHEHHPVVKDYILQ